MKSNNNFQKALELIDNSNSILITSHSRPDGDACGSIVAMAEALAGLGKKVKPLLLSELPRWYEFLFTEKPAILDKDITVEQLTEGRSVEFDLIFIVDTNSLNQLPKFEQYLKQTDLPVLVIDHHVTSDGLGSVELIDTAAAATALIIFDLFKHAKWQFNKKIAYALFVAIATDTGWFHFANTDSRVYTSCAELIDIGVKPTEIYHDLYQSFSQQRFKLMMAMLNTLELHLDGRYATQHILQTDFEQTGARGMDTENLIDECHRIGSVEAAVLFVELKDGRIKCSLRSRGAVDVRKIAQKFGGGGHIMAAGVHLPGPLKNAKKLINAEVEKQFQ